MKRLLLIVAIIIGCDRTPSAEEIKASQEKLNQGYAIVDKIMDNAKSTTDHVEGRELDPWGNKIRIDYKQEWTTETIFVRSAGPDGSYETSDDLTKSHERTKVSSVASGIPTWVWWVGGWGVFAILAIGLRTRSRRRHPAKNRRASIVGDFALVAIAPLSVLAFLLVEGLEFAGLDIDFEPFDFDLDLGDIDLDIDL